jgi:hypothetical protein
VIVLTNEEIEPLLNMPDCIAAIEQAFRDFGNGQAVDIPRQDAIVPNARPGAIHDLKTMSGSWPADPRPASRRCGSTPTSCTGRPSTTPAGG